MKNRRNFYRILQVQADAPVEVLKASYRTLMQRLKMHPDLGGDHGQAALLNEAFATLTDPATAANWPEAACASCQSPLFPAKQHHDGADARRAVGAVRSLRPDPASRPLPPSDQLLGPAPDRPEGSAIARRRTQPTRSPACLHTR